jgi:hypothetical protein
MIPLQNKKKPNGSKPVEIVKVSKLPNKKNSSLEYVPIPGFKFENFKGEKSSVSSTSSRTNSRSSSISSTANSTVSYRANSNHSTENPTTSNNLHNSNFNMKRASLIKNKEYINHKFPNSNTFFPFRIKYNFDKNKYRMNQNTHNYSINGNTLDKDYNEMMKNFERKTSISLNKLINDIIEDIQKKNSLNFKKIDNVNEFMEGIGREIYICLKYYYSLTKEDLVNRYKDMNNSNKNKNVLKKEINKMEINKIEMNTIVDYFNRLRLMVECISYYYPNESEKIINLLYWYYYHFVLFFQFYGDRNFINAERKLSSYQSELKRIKKNNIQTKISVKEKIIECLMSVYEICFYFFERKLEFTSSCYDSQNEIDRVRVYFDSGRLLKRIKSILENELNDATICKEFSNQALSECKQNYVLVLLSNMFFEILDYIFTIEMYPDIVFIYSKNIFHDIMKIFKYLDKNVKMINNLLQKNQK